MSNWTKQKRDDLPLKYFGDPAGKKYPIQDQDDVDSAAHLIGKAPAEEQETIKKRIIGICKALKLEPPKAWVEANLSSAVDDFSYSELMNALGAALGDDPDGDGDEDYPYVVDIMPSSMKFVYACDSQLYEQGFTLDDKAGVKLLGAPVPVRATTDYLPIPAQMSFTADSDGAVVYEGEIFRAGNYADKGLNASEEFLESLAENTGFAQIICPKGAAKGTRFRKDFLEFRAVLAAAR